MRSLKFVRFKKLLVVKTIKTCKKKHTNRHCHSKNKFGGHIVKWRR